MFNKMVSAPRVRISKGISTRSFYLSTFKHYFPKLMAQIFEGMITKHTQWWETVVLEVRITLVSDRDMGVWDANPNHFSVQSKLSEKFSITKFSPRVNYSPAVDLQAR